MSDPSEQPAQVNDPEALRLNERVLTGLDFDHALTDALRAAGLQSLNRFAPQPGRGCAKAAASFRAFVLPERDSKIVSGWLLLAGGADLLTAREHLATFAMRVGESEDNPREDCQRALAFLEALSEAEHSPVAEFPPGVEAHLAAVERAIGMPEQLDLYAAAEAVRVALSAREAKTAEAARLALAASEAKAVEAARLAEIRAAPESLKEALKKFRAPRRKVLEALVYANPGEPLTITDVASRAGAARSTVRGAKEAYETLHRTGLASKSWAEIFDAS